ncbi:MAG: DUF192 domain-containing protein [Solirubrobacterales bacterium]
MPRATLLGFDVPIATTGRSRLLGLALLDRAEAGDGLLIRRCRSVHTFGMRFHLDLIFLDTDDRAIEVRREVPPRRLVRCPAADSVLELPAPARPTP